MQSPPPSPDESLITQLIIWRDRGYDPQLHGTPHGWTLLLDTTKWGLSEPNERQGSRLIRFCTGYYTTPQEAIKAAQEVIK